MVVPPNHSKTGISDYKHIDVLYRYATMLTLESGMAESLVEKTYVCAMTLVKTFRSEHEQKIWLLTILRDLWCAQVEGQPTMTPLISDIHFEEEAVVVKEGLSEHPSNDSVSSLGQVRAAIEHLPVELREMVLLREWEDLSYQEIAGVVKCSTNTVTSCLCQARWELRSLLPSTFR